MARAIGFGILVSMVFFLSSSAWSEEHISDDCLSCHESEEGLRTGLKEHDKLPPEDWGRLIVDGARHKTSPHAKNGCFNCHEIDEYPHPEKPAPISCAECHDDEDAEYKKSVHGVWSASGDNLVATCTDCHGTHGIIGSSNRESPTNKFNLHKTCAACHQDEEILATRINEKEAVGHFVDSIHGRALLVDGLVVAPTCNDCHGVHDILPAKHPDSNISEKNVPDTCGKCHVLVEEVYNRSVHGELLAAGDPRGPTCVNCHTSHEVIPPTDPAFHGKSDRVCGSCHEDRLKRYRETFHGKAIALGRSEVAACSDCHGSHDIYKRDNPESHISDERRLETCRKCHPNANEGFADYVVHADHHDKENHPILFYTFWFMTLLVIGTFIFFGIHTIFWLFRSTALFGQDSKNFRAQKALARSDPEQYIRFRPIDRFLHGLLILSFLLLVVTGMPLKFFDTKWASIIFHLMGGQAVASVLHRAGAIMMVAGFVIHVLVMLSRFWRSRRKFRDSKTGKLSIRRAIAHIFGPDSPAPNLQDLRDFFAHMRWFFGKGEKPQFDRWTYWEKFDYFAVFWGVFIIGGSGLVMWVPELFTAFLPGWIINVALIVHSDEALLAAGFIFSVHFFNVHFRPEKFPIDSGIFSGRISKSEMLHERRKLLKRWESEGELDEHSATHDEWEARKWIVLPGGVLAFLLGAVLLVLIFYAMFVRLTGG